MERVTLPTFFVFIGHRRLQHAGAGWEDSSCLHYHAYIIPSYLSPKDAISFANRVSFSIQPSATYPIDGDDDDDDVIA